MKNICSLKTLLIVLVLLHTTGYSLSAQSPEQPVIEVSQARIIIDSLDKQFSRYFLLGDSMALYAMYAKDGSLGTLTGEKLLHGLGSMIQNAAKNNTRHIVYTTTSLSVDGPFIIEVGRYDSKNDNGEIKGSGKYLVVWKQEDGHWKLYRDIGL